VLAALVTTIGRNWKKEGRFKSNSPGFSQNLGHVFSFSTCPAVEFRNI